VQFVHCLHTLFVIDKNIEFFRGGGISHGESFPCEGKFSALILHSMGRRFPCMVGKTVRKKNQLKVKSNIKTLNEYNLFCI